MIGVNRLGLFVLFGSLFMSSAVFAEAEAPIFNEIAKVLLHPRCLNCHTSTGYPKQGDDRHRHAFGVVRGPDDHGAAAFRCSTCHQAVNNSASGVPGAPSWHTAPASMAWENLNNGSLCRSLLDRKKNGDRSVGQIVEHMSNDKLVAWGWAPGGTRQPVPISKAEFILLLEKWQSLGAPCP